MNADLERLIALQRLDSAAREAESQVAQEPDRLSDFEARMDTAREEVAAAKATLASSQEARRAAEKELGVHQGRLSKYRDQLMAVKTNVEYQAMQKEIEFAQAEVRAHEEKILERMLEADDLTASLKRAEAVLATEQKAIDGERKELATRLAEVRQTLVRLAAERSAVVGAIDAQVLSTFEKVSERRHGVGVAEARDGVCTICHVRLRPQVFNTVLKNEAITQCDHCQRILYFVPVPRTEAASSTAPQP